MTTPYWCLILNGKSTDDEALRAAVKRLRDQGVTLDVRVTWEQGDAERYVTEAIANGVDTVIAGGGDGTLSEVATTLARSQKPADGLPTLGLVPLGTANDFATAANMPDTSLLALELIAESDAQPIDLLRVTTNHSLQWCANMASGGFGTQVTLETDGALKRMLGGLAYTITGLSRLGSIEPVHARLEGPNFNWEGAFIAIGLGNGRQAGGKQELCPSALINDGLLDVTIVPELSGEMAQALGTLITAGKQAALEAVAVRARLPWVRLHATQSITLNLDGEPEAAHQFHIECVPARLRMHLPTGCPLLAND